MISYTQSRYLRQLIFVTINTFCGNSLHFKYDDKAIMFLILFLMYSILYLVYIVLIGVLSYVFNWSVHAVCCAVTICFKFSCLMTAIGSVKCVCVCVHACF